MPLSGHSVGTNQETSSHSPHQGTLGHSRLSSLGHCGLILAKEWNWCARANLHFKKKKKSTGKGMNCRGFSQNPRTRGRSHPHTKRNSGSCSFMCSLFPSSSQDTTLAWFHGPRRLLVLAELQGAALHRLFVCLVGVWGLLLTLISCIRLSLSCLKRLL